MADQRIVAEKRAAHTPGPWFIEKRAGAHWVNAPNGMIIAELVLEDLEPEQVGIDTANAQLIGAAPDLLAALKAMRFAVEGAIQMADAAIAKAEGAQ